MSADKVTVWYDDTSIEKAFIVDAQDRDGNSRTIEAFDDLIAAVRFGRVFARDNNLPFENKTDGW